MYEYDLAQLIAEFRRDRSCFTEGGGCGLACFVMAHEIDRWRVGYCQPPRNSGQPPSQWVKDWPIGHGESLREALLDLKTKPIPSLTREQSEALHQQQERRRLIA